MSTPNFRTNATMAPAGRTNAYPARCERCNDQVPAQQGSLTLENGQWVVRHHGDCLKTMEPVFVEPAPVAAPTPSAVPDGRYTVTFRDGSYRTLRVSTQAEDADFMPGKSLIAYLSGSDNDSDYTRFGHFNDSAPVIWKKHRDNAGLADAVSILLGDPKAAMLGYAEQSGCCARCGRTLTVPASLHAGLGPECSRKVSF